MQGMIRRGGHGQACSRDKKESDWSTLPVMEPIVALGNEPSLAKLLDLFMLVWPADANGPRWNTVSSWLPPALSCPERFRRGGSQHPGARKAA